MLGFVLGALRRVLGRKHAAETAAFNHKGNCSGFGVRVELHAAIAVVESHASSPRAWKQLGPAPGTHLAVDQRPDHLIAAQAWPRRTEDTMRHLQDFGRVRFPIRRCEEAARSEVAEQQPDSPQCLAVSLDDPIPGAPNAALDCRVISPDPELVGVLAIAVHQ